MNYHFHIHILLKPIYYIFIAQLIMQHHGIKSRRVPMKKTIINCRESQQRLWDSVPIGFACFQNKRVVLAGAMYSKVPIVAKF